MAPKVLEPTWQAKNTRFLILFVRRGQTLLQCGAIENSSGLFFVSSPSVGDKHVSLWVSELYATGNVTESTCKTDRVRHRVRPDNKSRKTKRKGKQKKNRNSVN